MADMRSTKSARTWRDLKRQFPKLYKLNLDPKEILYLVDLVDKMRAETPQAWRDQQLRIVVNGYMEQIEFLRQTGIGGHEL